MTLPVAAVDLGASSGRVCLVDLDPLPPTLAVVHRFAHEPQRQADGSLRWDWVRLVDETRRGLRLARDRAPVASIGIDTWGVDYGLLDGRGDLVAPPFCYRDARTEGWRDVAARLGEEYLYRTTGIQLLAIDTIFQLAAHDRSELARARHLLILPELMAHELTGALTAETSSAGTTALVDLATGDWSAELLDGIAVAPGLFAPITRAPARLGEWEGIPVHLVGGHDTASAVLAALPPGAGPGAAFVSSGTWLLVGRELDEPDVSDAARRSNFSNEAGALGGVRFLKNVTGFWLLEQCRAAWGDPPVDELLAAAERVAGAVPVVDVKDERFLAPAAMEDEIRAAAGLPASAGREVVVRCIVESLALAVAGVARALGGHGGPVTSLHVVGGGARAGLLIRLIEERCGVAVHAGPVEATALGNALVQGIALGRYADLTEARSALAPVGA